MSFVGLFPGEKLQKKKNFFWRYEFMEETMEFKPFEKKVWLATPTMHGEELKYMTEAYETNWMSTVGANINEVERLACDKVGCKYAVALSAGTAALHMTVKLAGMDAYGMPEVGHGALAGKNLFLFK